MKDALRELPEDQEDFYGLSLRRVREQGDSEYALKVIVWILFAKRQLKMEELQEAVAFSITKSRDADYRDYLVDGESLLEGCAGLVVYESESKAVKFAHLTVEEYLRRKDKLFDFHAEHMLAITCVAYLSFDAFKYEDESIPLGFVVRRLRKFQFFSYAATLWEAHVDQCRSSRVGEETAKFLVQESNVCSALVAVTFGSLSRYSDYDHTLVKLEKQSSLDIAASLGLHGVILKCLQLRPHTDIDAKSRLFLTTTLRAAARNRHDQAVQVLIDTGADIEAADVSGHTPNMLAARSGYPSTVTLLIRNDAKLEARSRSGATTMLVCAANIWPDLSMLRFLVKELRADVFAVDLELNNVLHTLCQRKFFQILKSERSPQKCFDEYVELVLFFSREGIDINSTNDLGMTPLHVIVDNTDVLIVKVLLEGGAERKIKDKKGQTPWTQPY